MTKRSFSREITSQRKRPRLQANSQSQITIPATVGVDLPDDIGDLCSYMDDGSLPDEDVDLVPMQCADLLQQQKQKIKRLKNDKQTLRRDLARSRRVGSTLESDMGRLRRQRHRELSYERRAKRDIQDREEVLTRREKTCTRLHDTFVRLKSTFHDAIRLHGENEVRAVVRDLVDRVELSTIATDIQNTQDNLAWLKLLEKDWRDCNVQLENEIREVEDLVDVEQNLLTERVESLSVQLKSTQQCLQAEERAGVELKTSYNLLQEEVTSKSNWLTALALGSMSLVNAQDEIVTRVATERAEWQRSVSQLQLQTGELQANYAKQLSQLQSENVQIQENLHGSKVCEKNTRKKLQSAQETATTCRTQQKKQQMEPKTLREKVTALQDELRAVKQSPLVKANSERLPTLRTTDFVAKCARDEISN